MRKRIFLITSFNMCVPMLNRFVQWGCRRFGVIVVFYSNVAITHFIFVGCLRAYGFDLKVRCFVSSKGCFLYQ